MTPRSQTTSLDFNSTNSTDKVWTSKEIDRYLEQQSLQAWESRITVITFFTILIPLGFFGNIVIISVYLNRFNQNSSGVLVLARSMLNVLTTIISIPLQLVSIRFAYNAHDVALCRAVFVFEYVPTEASLMFLVLIAFERYRRVCQPLKKQMSRTEAWKLSAAAIFLISVILGVFTPMFGIISKPTVHPEVQASMCWILVDQYGPSYYTCFNATLTIMFVVGLIATMFIYIRIAQSVSIGRMSCNKLMSYSGSFDTRKFSVTFPSFTNLRVTSSIQSISNIPTTLKKGPQVLSQTVSSQCLSIGDPSQEESPRFRAARPWVTVSSPASNGPGKESEGLNLTLLSKNLSTADSALVESPHFQTASPEKIESSPPSSNYPRKISQILNLTTPSKRPSVTGPPESNGPHSQVASSEGIVSSRASSNYPRKISQILNLTTPSKRPSVAGPTMGNGPNSQVASPERVVSFPLTTSISADDKDTQNSNALPAGKDGAVFIDAIPENISEDITRTEESFTSTTEEKTLQSSFTWVISGVSNFARSLTSDNRNTPEHLEVTPPAVKWIAKETAVSASKILRNTVRNVADSGLPRSHQVHSMPRTNLYGSTVDRGRFSVYSITTGSKGFGLSKTASLKISKLMIAMTVSYAITGLPHVLSRWIFPLKTPVDMCPNIVDCMSDVYGLVMRSQYLCIATDILVFISLDTRFQFECRLLLKRLKKHVSICSR